MREPIIFGAGFVIGAGIGGFYMRHKMEREFEDADDSYDTYNEYSGYDRDHEDEPPKKKKKKSSPSHKRRAREDQGEAERPAHERFKRGDSERKRRSRNITPEDQFEEANEMTDEDEEEDPEQTVEEVSYNNKPPKIVSHEKAEALTENDENISSETMFYYTDDDCIVDEDGNIIKAYEVIFGDQLDKYNFKENEDRCIFIYNPGLNTVYEIRKIRGKYIEEG